jgi:DNA-binding beta-propeller fold protein YncE
MKRNLCVGGAIVALLGMLGFASWRLDRSSRVQAATVQAPRFEVDPMWPKPLPNHWIVGNVIGVSVDSKDHIWIIHRGGEVVNGVYSGSLEAKEVYAVPGWNGRKDSAPGSECCVPAPPVLEFDEEGNLLAHWGGREDAMKGGYEWPDSNHGITVDYKGNVWIGGNGRGARPAAAPAAATSAAPEGQMPAGRGGPVYYHDSMVMKFTQDGKFLGEFGKPGGSKGSLDTENLGLPAKIFVDPKTNEVYVADGYGNKRVLVFDADTFKFKRMWGAYGHKPDDTNFGPYQPDGPIDQQFRNPVHCADLSNDGLLYVCDRVNDRMQVFKPDGTFVKEKVFYKNTLGDGSVWDVAFSKDPQQKYLYLADGSNEVVRILDRDSLEELANFGDGGRQPGQFYAVHSIATDSKGNIFTTETYRGQRVQKFVYKGLAPVPALNEGVPWPKNKK